MPRVRLNTLYASPLVVIQPGSIVDLSDEEAAELIAGHYASPVDYDQPEDGAPETAEAPAAPENAASPALVKSRRVRG